MAINLAKKYHDKLVKSLEYASNLAGKTTDEYKLDGGEGVYLTSLVPQALNSYNMAATSNRYGTPSEMQDVQQYVGWDYDKSYAITVDKANYQDGGYLKTAGAVIEEQNNSIVAPFIEQNFYGKLCMNAGKVVTGNAPTASDIMGRLTAIEAWFRNNNIPKADRFVAVPTTVFQLIRHALTNCDDITDKMLIKGLVGRIGSLNIVEVADSDLFSDVYLVAWYKRAALKAFDIKDARVHQDPPGINGILVEFRVRGVNSVIGQYKGGVYVDCKSTAKQANPSIAATGAITVGSSSDYTMYTNDGTDPRYSTTAVKITSGTTPSHTSGDTIKAVSYKAGKAVSDVVSQVTTS
jgi:hypothetical protein